MSDEWWRKFKPEVNFKASLPEGSPNRYQRRKFATMTHKMIEKAKRKAANEPKKA